MGPLVGLCAAFACLNCSGSHSVFPVENSISKMPGKPGVLHLLVYAASDSHSVSRDLL